MDGFEQKAALQDALIDKSIDRRIAGSMHTGDDATFGRGIIGGLEASEPLHYGCRGCIGTAVQQLVT